jgi:hypothetical protein
MPDNEVLVCMEKHSYQHVQGIMLLNLNRLSSELHLTHQEYRLMGVLIGLWNKKYGMAFPSIAYLTKLCRMGRTTILKALDNLTFKNLLIVVKTKGKRNSYYFSNILFKTDNCSSMKTTTVPDVRNSFHEHNRDRTIKNQALKIKNNDDINLSKKIKPILSKWQVSNPDKFIDRYGTDKIAFLIDFVKKKSPQNPGAYLRTLLNLPDVIFIDKHRQSTQVEENTELQEMLKNPFWKDKKTGKIYQVRPDRGNHLLIKYNASDKTFFFLDNDQESFKVDQFEVSCYQEYLKQNVSNFKKPGKISIINELLKNNREEEARNLIKLFGFKEKDFLLSV